MSYLKEVWAARELLANLTLREVRGKYKRTVFGQLWSLANPLALMLIYTFVFAFIFRIQPDAGNPSGLDVFALWLLCGLLPWTFLSNVINHGLSSIVENAGLIQKVSFTRVVLPLSQVGSLGYTWLFEMVVLVIAVSIAGAFVIPWIPLVVVTIILLAFFGAGVAFLLAIANVYFRDTQYFTSLLLQIWMYLTPIIYPVSLVERLSDDVGPLLSTPVTLLDIYRLNPMEHFVAVFRALLYDATWPAWQDWLWCISSAAILFFLGLLVFRRSERRLAELL